MDLTTAPPHHLRRLAETLWEERHLAVELHYRLRCARLLLAADEPRFVTRAIDEVQDVTGRLRQAELHREGILRDVAATLGADPYALTLATLATGTVEPWRSVFTDHRRAFLALAHEIEETSEAGRDLAGHALDRVHRSIAILSGPDATASTPQASDRWGTVPGDVLHLHRER